MGVTSKSAKLRNHLSLQTRRVIIERVIAGGERSFDLLLGILTFVNWLVAKPAGYGVPLLTLIQGSSLPYG